jgi:adenylosuccinate synthase
MPLDIVVGTQWGDEGKGRFVDLLAAEADYVARFNGGDNAGHTVTVGEQTFKLHLIPSGVIQPGTVGVIGNGVVVNPSVLIQEIDSLLKAGIEITPQRLLISYAAHLITPAHLALDRAQEAALGKGKIGTTLRGIGPAYTSKVSRKGLRMVDMLDRDKFMLAVRSHVQVVNEQLTNLLGAEPLDVRQIEDELSRSAGYLAPFIADVSTVLTGALGHGRRVLAEGAQGTLLDLDHGTYPFVTSSNPTAAGAFTGLGLGVGYEERVIGVTKAFQSRVGSGPFPTDGWLDMVLLRYSARINGLTELALTKLDILSGLDPIQICSAYRRADQTYSELPFGPSDLSWYEPIYEQLPGWQADIRHARSWEHLPQAARAYILRIEKLSGVPIRLVSVGPEREQVVPIA